MTPLVVLLGLDELLDPFPWEPQSVPIIITDVEARVESYSGADVVWYDEEFVGGIGEGAL